MRWEDYTQESRTNFILQNCCMSVIKVSEEGQVLSDVEEHFRVELPQDLWWSARRTNTSMATSDKEITRELTL